MHLEKYRDKIYPKLKEEEASVSLNERAKS